MAEATAQTQEKSLWDRISETSADIANKALLVRRGVQQSIAGIPAIPGYIVDLGNMGVKKLGADGYEGSAGGWIQGKVMQGFDAVDLDILKPTIKTESDQKWADYTEIGADVAMAIGTLGAGSVKLAGTGAKIAAKTAVKEAVKETAEATAKTTAKVTVEDTTSILAKAKAAGEAERAGVKVAAEAVEETAETGAKAGVSGASTTAKAEYSYSEVLKVMSREKDLAGRLEALSGHGPKAEAMIDRAIASARKTGVSGDDWAAIKNSRSLPQSVIDRVGKIRDDYVSSPWGIGPAWERAKGTAAYWKDYPLESAARAAAAPVAIPFKMAASAVTNNLGKTAVLGTGVAAYYGINVLADSPAPEEKAPQAKESAPAAAASTTSSAPARDVPIEETMAKGATDTAIFLSKLTTTSALAMALNAASKIPGLGTVALNSARGSAQSLVQEIADGEPDINKAWDISQEKLGKILPGVHLNTLGDFVKGKGIEDMSEEERTRVSDALTAITQPHSEKARSFRNIAMTEAKSKLEQAGQFAGMGGAAVASAASDVGEDLEEEGLKQMVGEFLGIDPKDLNARNIARVTRDLAGDNKAALAVGTVAGLSSSGGIMKKGLVGLVTTAVMAMLMPALMPMLMPLMGLLAPMLEQVKAGFAQKFNQSTTTGQFNTEANALVNRDRDPSATTPAPAAAPTAATPVASFRDNGNMMTAPVADAGRLGSNTKAPVVNRDLWAMTMNA